MTTRARILLVDDHELFREGVAKIINSQPDMEVVGQADDGLEALTMAHELLPDLVLMDINMPLSDGLEATALIHSSILNNSDAHVQMNDVLKYLHILLSFLMPSKRARKDIF